MPNFLRRAFNKDQWAPQGVLPEIEEGLRKTAQAFESPAQSATRVAQEDKALALTRQRGLDVQNEDYRNRALDISQEKNVAAAELATAKNQTALRGKGMKQDAAGNIIPVPENELTPKEQEDLKSQRSLSSYRETQSTLGTLRENRLKAQGTEQAKYWDEQIALGEARLEQSKSELGLKQEIANKPKGYDFAIEAENRGGKSVNVLVNKITGEKRDLGEKAYTQGERGQIMNAKSALGALEEFSTSYNKNGRSMLALMDMPGSLGARSEKMATEEMKDVVVRSRTGAALNLDEQKFYGRYVPSVVDSDSTVQSKIRRLTNLMRAVAREDEIGTIDQSAIDQLLAEERGGRAPAAQSGTPKAEGGKADFVYDPKTKKLVPSR